jgi:hypothetical protein
VEFVVKRQSARRHLSEDDRTLLAVEIQPRLEDEAKERQRQAGRERGKGKLGKGKLRLKSAQAKGKSAQQVADLLTKISLHRPGDPGDRGVDP